MLKLIPPGGRLELALALGLAKRNGRPEH